MTDFLTDLEKASQETSQIKWRGTFRDYLKVVKSGEFPHLNDLAHQRVHHMVLQSGTEKVNHFGQERTLYKFFENTLYGIEDSIDAIMRYIHSAAQRTETSRRMLLLYGPPSSGKSEIVNLLKIGLEVYSKTNEGATFTLKDSKMHENPFLLVPNHLRPRFEEEFGVKIEGELSPMARWRLENEFEGKFMEYPIERMIFSQNSRVGIGTWLPSDTKSQDVAELVGSIDLAKIAEIGDESDPRAYNFDGEINVGNRGVMEFIEGLKADEKFLRSILTATQEKSIKCPRFGLIYVDCFIIMHTNEEEFTHFMSEKKYEAYHDRMVIVKVPYNLSYSNEVKIYEKLLKNSDALSGVSMSPHTLTVAAMFAVLTRLNPEDHDTIIKKMKLYNKEHVRGRKIEEVPDIRKKSPREGMEGVSPRFVIDQITAAISRAKDEGRDYVLPLDVLRMLHEGVYKRDSYNKEQKQRYEEYLSYAREELNELLRNDIQKAFFLNFREEAKALCETYLDNVEAHLEDKKLRDPITGEEKEVDNKLMDNIEHQIGISGSGKSDFRNEIMRAFGTAARKGNPFDYTNHSQLRDAIEKQLFAERQGVIRMTVSSRNPDPEALRRINEVIDRMVEHQSYTAGAANEILKYATSHLFDKT